MDRRKLVFLLGLGLWVLVTIPAAVQLPAVEITPQSEPVTAVPRSIGPESPDEQSILMSNRSGPYHYELKFHLDVEGQISLVSTTRYRRYEDIHLKTVARAEKGQYQFDIVGLVTDHDELNYGIGEGPRRHQRYVLLNRFPSSKEVGSISQRVLLAERQQLGIWDESFAKDEKPDEEADSEEEKVFDKKKAYFNYYVWQNPDKEFSFAQTASGTIPVVKNDTQLQAIIIEGGRKARPRFFETLQYALMAIPPFLNPSFGLQAYAESSWQASCRPIMDGLVQLCREVYGRKMTLLEPASFEVQKVHYVSHRIPRTTITKIVGDFDQGMPTGIRVSGLKGEIWIEALRREVFLDTSTGRILKDDLKVSFGIRRKARLLALEGTRNEIHISLVDQCFLGCPDSHTGIATAARTCNSALPELQSPD